MTRSFFALVVMTAVPHALAIGQSVPAAPAAASVVAPKPIVWSRDPKVDSAFIANYSAPGIPAGYRLRIDPQTRYTTSLRYTRNAGAVLVKGGPGHIMYSPTDTASGSYSVTTTVSQRARSKPKDAYGLFVGGRSLTTSKQTYGYFLIREGGEYLVKVRDADSMRVIIDWTRHRAIPMDTARGAITASLAILVAPDSTRFVVNGQQVASLPAGVIPSSGIAGVRVNKDLQVRVAPVRIAR